MPALRIYKKMSISWHVWSPNTKSKKYGVNLLRLTPFLTMH